MLKITQHTGKLILLLIALATSFGVCGQSHNGRITGRIISSTTGQGVESVSVMLMGSDGTTTHGFSLTDKDGLFGFFRPEVSSEVALELHISGFNVESKSVPISVDDNDLVIKVEQKILEIREVVVEATSESRRGDTISFVASSYKGGSDRVIGDLLKRIPGIEVSQSGKISYEGENINRFYVEDMDMLGGRYTVAVNNISAEDIASIQVYEDHQPIAALRGLSNSSKAAINIRLKDDAKGTLGGSVLLGGGVANTSPLYKGAATGLYFNSRLQAIATYKTGNTGEDLTLELEQYRIGDSGGSTLLGVTNPTPPPIAQERYLNNYTHTASLNAMVRLKKGLEFIANGSFVRDRRLYEGEQRSVYMLPDGESVVVGESTSVGNNLLRADAMFTLRSNGQRCYIQNRLLMSVEALESLGSVSTDGNATTQNLARPRNHITNDLYLTGLWGNWVLSLTSTTSLQNGSEELRITPLSFGQLFEGVTALEGAVQSVATNGVATTNLLSAGYQIGGWNVGMHGSFNLKQEKMNSVLTSLPDGATDTPEAYRNNIHFSNSEVGVGPYVRYASSNNFQLTFNIPVRLVDITNRDLLRNHSEHLQRVVPSPSLTIMAKPWRDVGLQATANRVERFGSLYNSYAGYIMSNYRQIGAAGGVLPRTTTTNYTLALTYDDIFSLLSGSIRGGYIVGTNSVIYNTTYDGALMRLEGVEVETQVSQWHLNGKLSKRFRRLHTTVTLSAGIQSAQGEVLCENQMVENSSEQLSVGLTLVATPLRWAELTYSGALSSHTNTFNHQTMSPIGTIRQQAELKVSLSKLFGRGGRLSADRLNCILSGQHFHNGSLVSAVRNIFFMDAGVGWHGEKFEWLLRGQNLLNYNSFSSSSQSGNLDYSYSYVLRPRALIAEVRFSF